jgi:hypothetical protein
MLARIVFLCLALIGTASAFQSRNFLNRAIAVSKTPLNEVPYELLGQLDPSKKWEVTLRYHGEEKKVTIREDTSVLEKAERVWPDVQSSCRNGVCTTCSGKVK